MCNVFYKLLALEGGFLVGMTRAYAMKDLCRLEKGDLYCFFLLSGSSGIVYMTGVHAL